MLTVEDKSSTKSAMITREPTSSQQAGWQQALAAAVTDPRELLAMLELDMALLPAARAAHQQFRLRVPRGFVARMRPRDPADPLLRQVLPLAAELRQMSGFISDPVGDGAATLAPALLSKYSGRALFIASGACAINCRYCFRREYPYGDGIAAAADWAPAFAQLDRLADVDELILSGGDPLTLSDARLHKLGPALARRPWIRRLRIHSRLPVVLPERIDSGFLAWADALPIPLVLVIHTNHANEFDGTVATAMADLRRAGVMLLNQSVLLAGSTTMPTRWQTSAKRCLPTACCPTICICSTGCAVRPILKSRRTGPDGWPEPSRPGCRAIWYRAWCGKCPARPGRRH